MKMSGNTILITGGGSGIGLGLAKEFLELGNKVIITGRSQQKLKAAAQIGLEVCSMDMTKTQEIQKGVKDILAQWPSLNIVIHNAGIMKTERLTVENSDTIQTETITTNLLGPMRLTDALLPHFLKKDYAAILTVTSGLAYLPLAMTPSYCASKAGLHSYTESLRYQLKNLPIDVIEIAPPYVQTELTGAHQATDPNAMPLDEFISEVMEILKTKPDITEVLVKRVHPLRFSFEGGHEKYLNFFNQFNDHMTAQRDS